MALRTCFASVSGSLRSFVNAKDESGRSFFCAVLSPDDFLTLVPRAFALDALVAFLMLRRAASFCLVVDIATSGVRRFTLPTRGNIPSQNGRGEGSEC